MSTLWTAVRIFSMTRETENLGDTRARAECPRTNVRYSRPHVASSLRETPMKPSQVPNKVPHPPPRRTLSQQSSHMCKGSGHYPHHQPVSRALSAPSSQGSVSSSINGLHPAPKHRWPSSHHPVGSSGTKAHAPLTSTRGNATTDKSQTPASIHHSSASPKVINNVHSHTRIDPTTKSKDTFSNSGSKNIMTHRHESHKQMQDKRSCSSEIPVNIIHSSQKRHREYDPCDVGAKKTCCQSENQQTSAPKPTAASPRTTGIQPSGEPVGDLSTIPECKSKESSCASVLLNSHTIVEPPKGVQKAVIRLIPNECVALLEVRSDSDDGWLKKFSSLKKDGCVEENASFSIKNSQKDTVRTQQSGLSSGQPQHETLVLSVKNSGGGNMVEETQWRPAKTASKPKKTACSRRSSLLIDDITNLFTPDPVTYMVMPVHKAGNPNLNGNIKSASTEAHPSMAASRPMTTPTPSNKTTGSVNLRKQSPDTGPLLKENPVETTVGQLNPETVQSSENRMLDPCTLESDTIQKTSPAPCCEAPPEENQACGETKQQSTEDPLDVESDLDLSLDFDLSQSSKSSEEDEPFFSLHDMMNRCSQPLDTPEKETFSEPSVHGDHSQSKTQPLPSAREAGVYKNSLDQMLKEKKTTERAKEIEEQLLTACKEGLLEIAEFEKPEEINTEQQEFLQRYSLTCNAIRDVPPGEEVFNLDRFGQIFNQDTLQLKICVSQFKESTQRSILTSSPAQLKRHICVGMFQEVFNSHLPCPAQVSQFLFKLMSVHNERMVSEKTLKALCDIACTAAYEIVSVKNGEHKFEVWVPTLADIALVLMNMGAAFVVLFPSENLQPSFSERDLLEENTIRTKGSITKDQGSFPEHNYNNILKYLSYCMTLCPRAYSDEELLLLLTVVSRVSLDTRLLLQPSVDLYPLQYKILYNIRDWKAMLPRICLAVTNLTDDHHNMCLLVQLLPHDMRRKQEVLQLRQHLSLSMISKLLDGHCAYRPAAEGFKLSELRPYLPLMRPSSLLRRLSNSSSRSQKDMSFDQEAYYLCYSLLTLANEASNFQPIFPANQKKEVHLLCSDLDAHIKCDIRESVECLYRSKVKDLVARMYTKWQILLQRTKPLDGKLYDYYLPADVHNSQEEQEVAIWEDEEGPGSEDEKIAACSEDEETNEGKDIMNDSEETEDSSKWDKPDETAATNTDSNALTAEQDTGVHRRVVGAEGEGSEAGCEDGT